MSTVDSALTKIAFAVATPKSPAWKVTQAKPPQNKTATAPKRTWLGLFQRREPTTYQRCLAVHIHFAGERSSLR
jgi:hypothetical protein